MSDGVKTVALELQPCCGQRSGIGIYTYELAKRLQSNENIHFCGNIFNFCGRNDNSVSLKGIGMPLNESRIFPYGIYRRIWNLLPISYEYFFPTQADLTIFFNYIVPPRVHGKVITTIYDMTYLRFPETMNSRNLRRLKEGMQRSMARSDRILTISSFSKQEIIDLLHVPDEKISVIPCAPSFSNDLVDFNILKQKFGLNKPYLLYVGTIEPRKNLVRLIQAYEQLKRKEDFPYQLVLAGGKGWQNQEIYQTANTSTFRDDIIFTGYISDAEKNCLYENAALFVFPSIYEGFGMPPLEAMHWGCPVVSSTAASLPEVVGDAAELVDPLSVGSITSGIQKVISNKSYADTLRSRGSRQVTRYTWDLSADLLYKSCLEALGATTLF